MQVVHLHPPLGPIGLAIATVLAVTMPLAIAPSLVVGTPFSNWTTSGISSSSVASASFYSLFLLCLLLLRRVYLRRWEQLGRLGIQRWCLGRWGRSWVVLWLKLALALGRTLSLMLILAPLFGLEKSMVFGSNMDGLRGREFVHQIVIWRLLPSPLPTLPSWNAIGSSKTRR